MGIRALLLAGTLLTPVSTRDPVYPPQTRGGGAVFAVLSVQSGAVAGVELILGQEPFTSSARDALSHWRFPAGRIGRVPVVIVYASPFLTQPGGRGTHTFATRASGVATPRLVTEPVYPVRGAGGGTAVLALEVDRTGGIKRTTPLGPK